MKNRKTGSGRSVLKIKSGLRGGKLATNHSGRLLSIR
jgi:hypothetical protein